MRRRFQFSLGFVFAITFAAALVAAAIRATRDGAIATARAQLQQLKNLQAECHAIAASPRTIRVIDAKVQAAERRVTELQDR